MQYADVDDRHIDMLCMTRSTLARGTSKPTRQLHKPVHKELCLLNLQAANLALPVLLLPTIEIQPLHRKSRRNSIIPLTNNFGYRSKLPNASLAPAHTITLRLQIYCRALCAHRPQVNLGHDFTTQEIEGVVNIVAVPCTRFHECNPKCISKLFTLLLCGSSSCIAASHISSAKCLQKFRQPMTMTCCSSSC